MDDVRLGRVLRALRRRRGWRQVDLAAAAGCSQQSVSLVERGHLDALSVRRVRALVAALDARFEGAISWRGGDIDRLADAAHAALVEAVAALLRRLGWDVRLEVTYSVFGERGSIDLLAVRADARAIVVVEVKTQITAVEELIRRHDQKRRLGPRICEERFGWKPIHIAAALVLREGSTHRRTVARHERTFGAAYPLRGPELRAWFARPAGQASGIWFLSSTNGCSTSTGVVRPKRPAGAGPRSGAGKPSGPVPSGTSPGGG